MKSIFQESYLHMFPLHVFMLHRFVLCCCVVHNIEHQIMAVEFFGIWIRTIQCAANVVRLIHQSNDGFLWQNPCEKDINY